MDQQVCAVLMTGIGAVGIAWGVLRIDDVRRLRSRDVILRLTDEGIACRTGSLADDVRWARLAWADVLRIDIGPAVVTPPLTRDRAEVTVLRFVARADDAIQVDTITPYDAVKGAALD